MQRLELNDYDVLGIGAAAKSALLRRRAEVSITLVQHAHSFLPGLLEETLSWLRPDQIVTSSIFPKHEILRSRFQQIFPQGAQLLGDMADKVLNDYLQEFPWEEGLLSDHFRYFSEFMRPRFSERSYYEVFQWEWAQTILSYADLGRWAYEPGIYKVNPGLMISTVGEKAAEVLNCELGLYVHVYSAAQEKVIHRCLSRQEAEVLDLLAEDRKFSRSQVLELLGEKVKPSLDSLAQNAIISVDSTGVAE